MPTCKTCGYVAQDWQELARHIRDAKRGHSRSKKFAASVLLNVRTLNSKKDKPEQSSMTLEEKAAVAENKKEIHTELSGDERSVRTYCPSCKTVNVLSLPVEYIESEYAWRVSNGTLVVCCPRCRRR